MLRKFFSKAAQEKGKDFKSFFDPLRNRIRVMPVSRVPNPKGKSSEYYFVEATKMCLNNNLRDALQSLHKGLSLNPIHLFCRFTHGVLMFKMGMLTQAKADFEMIRDHYPKEHSLHYNLALTYFQLGQYLEALEKISVMIDRAQAILLSYKPQA